MSSIEQIERVTETESSSSSTSSSNAGRHSQVTLGEMPCKARLKVPKMQGQTVVVTQLSQVKAQKTKVVVPLSERPGSLTQKRTHLIEAADDDEIVVKIRCVFD